MMKKLITKNGVEIAYADQGEGPVLFFVHNGGTSSSIWRDQVAELSTRYRTIIIDLPGFGASPRTKDKIDYATQVGLLGAVLDELKVDKALAVGNCMGSNLAVGLAETRPEIVNGLVLINPLTEATFTAGMLGPLHTVDRWVPWGSRLGRSIARHFVPASFTAVNTLRLQLGDKGIAKNLHHDPELLAVNQRPDQLPALVDVLDNMSAYGGLDRIDQREHAHALPPICTIWGAQNKMLSPEAGKRLNDVLHPVRSEVIEGCGHLPMLEDPDAVTRVIDEFAQR